MKNANDPDQPSAASDSRVETLLRVARVIVRETGNFDLPMRALASRARMSLRAPYQIFGSKNGIIRALLLSEQQQFAELLATRASADPLDAFFDRTQLAMRFYAREPEFYRSLFRATQGYSGGNEPDPAWAMRPIYVHMLQQAQDSRLIRPELDAELVGAVLTSIFAATLRYWASSDCGIQLTGQRICLGFALVLSSAVTLPNEDRMRVKVEYYQNSIRNMTQNPE